MLLTAKRPQIFGGLAPRLPSCGFTHKTYQCIGAKRTGVIMRDRFLRFGGPLAAFLPLPLLATLQTKSSSLGPDLAGGMQWTDTLRGRVARLERHSRRLRWAAATTILLLGVGLAMGAASWQEVPQKLEARTLNIVS